MCQQYNQNRDEQKEKKNISVAKDALEYIILGSRFMVEFTI